MASSPWIGFDFDGTINNSDDRHAIVLQRVYPRIVEIADWKRRLIQAKREGKSTCAFLFEQQIDQAVELAGAWSAIIEEPEFLEIDRPYSGAIESLAMLKKTRSLALCSARQSEMGLLRQLQSQNCAQLFDRIIVVSPGPGAGQRKATATSDLELVAVVGDTECDGEWASAAGATFLPVAWGFRNGDFWRRLGLQPMESWHQVLKALGTE